MADFEITVNGKWRFQEGYVRAITIVADPSASGLERVALHVGMVVTEEAAICPACLRAARDLTLPRSSGHC